MLSSSYRPLSLIDGLAKVYEYMLKVRLEEEITKGGGLAARQYGFRAGRSTIEAISDVRQLAEKAKKKNTPCVLVTLDVRNAFNTARWSRILTSLRNFGISDYLQAIIRDYLSDRILRFKAEGQWEERRLSAGVPQGSVLGPLLWNMMYDGVLRTELPRGAVIIGYADDIAVVVRARIVPLLMDTMMRAVDTIQGWLTLNSLEIAPQKTEAMVLSGARKIQVAEVQLLGTTVTLTRQLSYLGVRVDTRLSFKGHVESVCNRADKIVAALSGIMPNLNGPGEARRRLLCSVASSVILYAVPTWARALNFALSRERLIRVQRKCAIRVVRAYRTVSTNTVLLLARMTPIDIVARGRIELYEWKRENVNLEGERPIGEENDTVRGDDATPRATYAAARKEVEERCLQEWQRRWNSDSKGAWTHTLIRDIKAWQQRRHGNMSYHLTQAFTGHGCFSTFLNRIGKEADARCWFCGEARDDAERTLFYCAQWSAQRRDVERVTGEITPINLVSRMLESRENWNSVANFVAFVIKEKEDQERIRERTGLRRPAIGIQGLLVEPHEEEEEGAVQPGGSDSPPEEQGEG